MKITSLFAAGAAMLFISCSDSDDRNIVGNVADEISFSHYTYDSTVTNANHPEANSHYFFTGNIVDGKLFSITTRDGVTTQEYFYNGDLLTAANNTQFFYDSSGNVIGAQKLIAESGGSNAMVYYRFIHPSANVVYSERLSAPYNSASTELVSRNILEFDNNDNVIRAGRDQNLDGIIDAVNTFGYANENLVSMQKPDGTTQPFSYATIIDNFSVLEDNSYGKKLRRIICAERYAWGDFANGFSQSRNLLSTAAVQDDYEVLDNNFYKKKTVSTNVEAVHNEIVTEFFFN